MFNNSTFDLAIDNNFFAEKGQIIKLYRSMYCPCGSDPSNPTRSNNNCILCGGSGRFYPDPPITKNVVITRVEQDNPDLIASGLAVPGDLVMTESMLDPYPSEQFDLVTPQWGGMPFDGQIITRGSGTTDTLYYHAVNVDRCVTVNPSTGVVTSYSPKTDFTFSGRALDWINPPPLGTNYSVRYSALFNYVVFPPAFIRREGGTDIGSKAILRKRHLVFPNLPDLLAG